MGADDEVNSVLDGVRAGPRAVVAGMTPGEMTEKLGPEWAYDLFDDVLHTWTRGAVQIRYYDDGEPPIAWSVQLDHPDEGQAGELGCVDSGAALAAAGLLARSVEIAAVRTEAPS